MMVTCPIHGPSLVCIYSPAFLVPRADGSLPDKVVVEVKDTPTEEAFFRFIVSPEEAAKLPIIDGRIPFDPDAFDIMDGLSVMCCHCFPERRQALKS